jgi:serine/threonine-protein kinase
VVGITVWNLTRPAPVPLKRFAVHLPPGDELSLGRGSAISPDGQNVVYVAGRRGGGPQLYLRPMDQLEATPLRGTEGARGPFFSPDGQWIGFHAGGKLKKVSIAGGSPVTLCDARTVRGASWGRDDTIFFSTDESSKLLRVSASGGKPEAVRTLDLGKEGQGPRWPKILPGGKAVLYTAWSGSLDNASIEVQSLETGERRILVQGGISPHYVPTRHIVFARGGSLLAVPFDLGRLEIAGSPVPVIEGVQVDSGGGAQFSLSSDGSVLYVPGSVSLPNRKLVWVDRQGVERPVAETLRAYVDPRLSPDGQRLAVSIHDASGGVDIWVLELARGTLTRLTFGEGASTRPIWSSDGERVIFGSSRVEGTFSMFSKPADGSGIAEQLTTGAFPSIPASVSSDGKAIVFRQNSDTTGLDIGMVRLEGEREPEILLGTPFDEHTGMLSPDDRWLAYVSNESGREEIYVRPFPGPGGRMQVSTEGGTEPMWSPDGRELFYRNGEKMMAVAISSEPELAPGKPTLLFEGRYETGLVWGTPSSNYDVAPDGRFVMIRTAERPGLAQLNIVLNWFEELKRLVPTK